MSKLTEEQRSDLRMRLFVFAMHAQTNVPTNNDCNKFITDYIEPLLQPVWHTASEPPEPHKDVLWYRKNKMAISRLILGTWDATINNATHWAELPTPPTE